MRIGLSLSRKVFSIFAFALATSCSTSFEEHHKAQIQTMKQTLVDAAKEAPLFQKESTHEISELLTEDTFTKILEDSKIQPTYSVNLNKAPADSFFATLADLYDQSIVISPDVQGEITLNMKDVTINEILTAIRQIYGFEFEKTAYGYNIFMPRLETRMFMIDRLDIERTGTSSMYVSSPKDSGSTSSGGSSGGGGSGGGGGGSSGGTSVSTHVKTDFWTNLKETIEAIISTESLAAGLNRGRRGGTTIPSGHVVINKDSGLIVVRGYPQQLRQVEAYLNKTQKTLQRQVIIEAKILDVELNAQNASGINWSALSSTLIDTRRYNLSFSNGETSKTQMSGTGSQSMTLGLTRTNGHFGSVLNLLEGQGKISVLSSPRISTLNNQKAVIKVGTDSFYSTSANSSSLTGSQAAVQNTSNVSLQSFFSGIALDVTPQISSDEQITLHIHPVITDITAEEQNIVVAGQKTILNAPSTRTREADTIVRAKNGQIIIIGGLMQSGVKMMDSKPNLSDNLGVINDLLGQKNHQKSNKELIILLKPVIVEDDTWEKELKNAAESAFKIME